ncbi:MAG: hypothetical protein P8P30_10090 [Rickettsiales bacterium]|nr:hypothetical protein [Rickettsiales bacterium]
MTTSLLSANQALGGEICNGQILCPGPGHSKHDRSLSVKFEPSAPDGFVVHSFAGDEPMRCRNYVKKRLKLSSEFSPPVIKREQNQPSANRKRRARALKLWRQARSL